MTEEGLPDSPIPQSLGKSWGSAVSIGGSQGSGPKSEAKVLRSFAP